jgi:hypothetical protein
VQPYVAVMPGWKRDVGHRLDALIVRTVPDVRKAVKWNSTFYGIEGQGCSQPSGLHGAHVGECITRAAPAFGVANENSMPHEQ